MNSKHVAIVTIAVIALCLVTSYLYIEDRTVQVKLDKNVQVGDYAIFEFVGQDTAYKTTITALNEDGSIDYELTSFDPSTGETENVATGKYDNVDRLFATLTTGPIGEEAKYTLTSGVKIQTSYGKVDCDVYEYSDGSKYYYDSKTGVFLYNQFVNNGEIMEVFVTSSLFYKV